MTFGESVSTCFRKYAVFKGRASLSEFWWFFLFQILISIGVFLVSFVIWLFLHMNNMDLATNVSVIFGMILWFAILILLLVPHYAVGARRLHDTGKSGWIQLLVLVPYIGYPIVLILYALKGTEGPNYFGEDPIAGTRFSGYRAPNMNPNFSGNRIVDDIKRPNRADRIVYCPSCSQKMAVPNGKWLKVTCPSCQRKFGVIP